MMEGRDARTHAYIHTVGDDTGEEVEMEIWSRIKSVVPSRIAVAAIGHAQGNVFNRLAFTLPTFHRLAHIT